MRFKIEIPTSQNRYPVYFQEQGLKYIGSLIKSHFNRRPVLVITDKNVWKHYGEKYCKALEKEGLTPFTVVLKGGEEEKSLETVSKIYNYALNVGVARDGLIIALGGGVIGDLAGFVAATYMRGISFIQIPTTLLSMVDSSIGGKVAVNHPTAKNIIGSFYQPSFVLVDEAFLGTLPSREITAGLAELIKYGIGLDFGLFRQLELSGLREEKGLLCSGGAYKKKKGFNFLKLIAKAVLIKGKVVAIDERDKGIRALLNLGHTFGHALESATGYQYYLHGEAVALGMMAATRLSQKLNNLNERDAGRICELLGSLDLPPPPEGLSAEKVLNAMASDKKKQGTNLVFVLPSAIGESFLYKSPPRELIKEAVVFILGENKKCYKSSRSQAQDQNTAGVKK